MSRKPRFLKKNLTDWNDETLQRCCHTITRSPLKLSQSLAIFTSLYSPWDPYKLCWKKKNWFFLKIFYFSICLTSDKFNTGLKTNSPTFLLDFIRRRVGVGELTRWRVDPSATWLDTVWLQVLRWMNNLHILWNRLSLDSIWNLQHFVTNYWEHFEVCDLSLSRPFATWNRREKIY